MNTRHTNNFFSPLYFRTYFDRLYHWFPTRVPWNNGVPCHGTGLSLSRNLFKHLTSAKYLHYIVSVPWYKKEGNRGARPLCPCSNFHLILKFRKNVRETKPVTPTVQVVHLEHEVLLLLEVVWQVRSTTNFNLRHFRVGPQLFKA